MRADVKSCSQTFFSPPGSGHLLAARSAAQYHNLRSFQSGTTVPRMNHSSMRSLFYARACRSSALALALSACVPLCAAPGHLQRTPTPDFGPNVLVFNAAMSAASIQEQIDKVYAVQQHSEFGSQRNAFLFMPGEYHVDIPVGFYTHVLGLGYIPEAVHIIGNVHSDASLARNNATCTFWRGIEGLAVTPSGGAMQWA